jgi:hypothetical protein
MTDSRLNSTPPQISLPVTPGVLERFCLLTGGGFRIRTQLDGTVRDTLCHQWGVDGAYVDGRIQTIFLNGQVVDDPGAAPMTAGATPALSAAMPGIAGAIRRSCGSKIGLDSDSHFCDSPK